MRDGDAPEPPAEDDPPVATAADATKMAAGLGLALTLGALAGYGTRAGLSVAVGALIAVANLVALRAIIRALLPSGDTGSEDPAGGDAGAQPQEPATQSSGTTGAWAVFAALKMAILFGGVWFLLTRGVVDPMPLVVGYGVLPLGITASALFPPKNRRK